MSENQVSACADKLETLDLKGAKAVPAGSCDGDDAAAKFTLSAEAAEFVPRWLKSEDSAASSEMETSFSSLEPAVAEEYREYAQKIVKSPNQADEILPAMLDKLSQEETEARGSALRGFTAILINHAATEHSARHAMGRMVNVLLQTVATSKKHADLEPEFWSALKAAFIREHDNAPKTLTENPVRYKTFAFFLAEVLGTSSRMFGHQKADELSDMLVMLLEDFFRTEDGEQWKIAGQVLKQVGAYLEDNFARRKDSSGQSNMDKFMLSVQNRGHSGREDIPFYIRSMLINIIELRAYNWGRSCSPSDAPAPPTVSAPSPPQVITNHGSNSLDAFAEMPLNAEERRFLESEGCFIDDGHDDDGMDEEMQKDYELFLQMNSNGK